MSDLSSSRIDNVSNIAASDEASLSSQIHDTRSSSNGSSALDSGVMSGFQSEQERRASIKAIIADKTLSEPERRKSIQLLMDGRRRNSFISLRRSSTGLESIGDTTRDELFVDDDGTDTDPSELSASRINRKSFKRSYSEPLHTSSIKFDVLNLHESYQETFSNIAYDVEGNPTGDPKEFESNRPKCDHYERNCSLISPCCGMVFGCRICHDECDALSPPIFKVKMDEILLKNDEDQIHIPQKIKLKNGQQAKFSRRGSMNSIMSSISEMGDDVHHNFDRFAVKEVICRACFTRQSCKTNNCIHCKIQFGEYHCNICNLWMKAEEEPYHCFDCGFCRVGGRDKFKHCYTCGMCIDANLIHDHNCRSGKYATNCPVCYEDLFSSRSACHEMPCGHNIHWNCFNQLASHDIRCPICKKTATDEDMNEVWDEMAMDIAMQPLPPEHCRVVDVYCNDCEGRDENRRWHYLGVQCRNCSSFNTSSTIKMTGVEAYSYLAQLDTENGNSPHASTPQEEY